jgi:hypothetical protein
VWGCVSGALYVTSRSFNTSISQKLGMLSFLHTPHVSVVKMILK